MAINFPTGVHNLTYDFGGIRYSYYDPNGTGGYWRVATAGTTGAASGAEVNGATDAVKYISPKALSDSAYLQESEINSKMDARYVTAVDGRSRIADGETLGNTRHQAIVSGGQMQSREPLATGSIHVRLPNPFSEATMVSFWVDIFEYSLQKSVSYFISGYCSTFTSSWINVTANRVGGTNIEDKHKVIKFGKSDAGYPVIQFGEAGSIWSYPQVLVRDMHLGYLDTVADSWFGDWLVAVVPQDVGTINYILDPSLVASKLETARNIQVALSGQVSGLASAAFDGSGNITINVNTSSVRAIGDVQPTAGHNTVPEWGLYCNGAEVSRTTYSELFAAIGTLYGAGDGSSTFNIPDYRGVALRGVDHGRGLDPSRTLGSYQDDDYKSHAHLTDGTNGSNKHVVNAQTDAPFDYSSGSASNQDAHYILGSKTGMSGGTETRMKNVSVHYYIVWH